MLKTENRRTVLKASAGTGKTYRLSMEFIGNLIKGKDYKDIVVMTFTKKATAEIKERIYDFLYQIAFNKEKELEENLKSLYNLSDREIDKEKLQNIYFEMIKNKEEIRIYTIDGFTNRIFKTAIAPSLGVYSYETLDEEEDMFYADILAKILDNEEYFRKFEFIIKEKGDKKNIGTYIEFIKHLIFLQKSFLLSQSCIDTEEAQSDYSFIKYAETLFKNIEDIAEIKNSKNADTKPVTYYIRKDFHNIYMNFKDIDTKIGRDIDENRREKIEVIIRNWELFYGKDAGNSPNIQDGNKAKGKDVEHITESMKNNKEAFLKSLSKYIYVNRILPLHNGMKVFSEDVYNLIEKVKIASKKFTHDDISTYTYKFIFDEKLKFVDKGKATEEFLDLIGGKIETVMIDEFQDTSVLQWKILKLLISGARNVICVGDEKQSIYRWRGGEKELFEKLEKIIDGKVENLGKSYRSYKEVVDNINNIYKAYSKDWNYIPVEYREDDEYQGGYFKYFINETNKKDKRDDCKDIRGYQVIIDMIKNGEIENLGKSCIICRKNDHLNEIAERLNEEGIPYTLSSNASILEHGAIKPIYRLMKYFLFNNPIYLLEFMRSDLIGCLNSHVKYILENKDEITRYINGYGEDNFHDFVKNSSAKVQLYEYNRIEIIERNGLLFSEILLKIRKLKKLSKKLNEIYHKENFSREIIESLDLIKYYPTNSDIKNIFNFFNILKGYNTLFEFITYMDGEKDRITQTSSEEVDAINLMTIHKSKGLEFDTVFYYKKDSFHKRDNDEITQYLKYDNNFDNVEKFLIVLKKYKKVFIDGYYRDLKEEIERKKEMEEINEDYVALTRAKKNLILVFDVLMKDESYVNGLANRLVSLYEMKEFSVGKIIESRKMDAISDIESYKYLDRIIPYFSDNVVKIVKSEHKVNLEKEFMRKKGLAIHYYFEHIYNNLAEDSKIAKSALLNRYGNLLGKKVLSDLIGRIEKFTLESKKLYSPEYKVYTEFEIYDEEGKKSIIDRINIDEEKKEIYIYDYKTGYEPLENEKYREQIENYKNVLDKKLKGEYKIFTEILEV